MAPQMFSETVQSLFIWMQFFQELLLKEKVTKCKVHLLIMHVALEHQHCPSSLGFLIPKNLTSFSNDHKSILMKKVPSHLVYVSHKSLM